MRNSFLFLLLVAALTFSTGCVKKAVTLDNCSSEAFSNNVLDKLNVWNETIPAYANEPTQTNCDAYKAAGQDYIDALANFETCATIFTADWRESLQEARVELANETCM